MKLYKLINKYGGWYVVAEHPTAAEEKLLKHLGDADYGFFEDRKVTRIDLIATEARDKRFITNHFLVR